MDRFVPDRRYNEETETPMNREGKMVINKAATLDVNEKRMLKDNLQTVLYSSAFTPNQNQCRAELDRAGPSAESCERHQNRKSWIFYSPDTKRKSTI